MDTRFSFLFFCSLFGLLILSIAKTSYFRPKALILPVTKDLSSSTPQYITQLQQRTPLVPIKLTIDLGGISLWVNCEKDYYLSTTFEPAQCGSTQCSLFGLYHCNAHNICGQFPRNTVAAISTYGDIAQDVVSIQSTNGFFPGIIVSRPNFLFFCGSKDMLEGLAHGVTGMAGLGRSSVSLASQFPSAFGLPKKFAICLSSSITSTGAIFFGDGPYNFLPKGDVSKSLTYTPLITNPVNTAFGSFGQPSNEYFIGVKSIRINGVKVPLNTTLLAIDKEGFGGTKISTVNPYTVMEASIYKAVVEAFSQALGGRVTKVAPIAPFGTCFATKDIGFSLMGPTMPSIDFLLQNEKVVWSMIGENSMVQVSNDVICLGFVDAGTNPSRSLVGYVEGGSKPRASITIGAHQLENNFLQFDLVNSRLGFSNSLFLQQTSCANFDFT